MELICSPPVVPADTSAGNPKGVTNTAPIRNQLLQALQPEDLLRISGLLTRVVLRPRQMLHVGRMPRERLYFIESGLVSVSGGGGRGKTVEAWLLGFEGTTAVPSILQDDESALQCVVQIGGEALEIGRVEFMAAMEACPGIRTLLLRYVNFTLLCAVQTGICNSNHSIEQRLARWLLFARDGFPDQNLPITHRALGRLLGVRRASITHSLGALEQGGAISVARGNVLISDQQKLNQRACECARYVQREYQRLISPAYGFDTSNAD